MDYADFPTAAAAALPSQGRAPLALRASGFLLDRTFALFLGVGVGAMIGLSFLQHQGGHAAPVAAAPPAPISAKAAAPAAREPQAPADAAVPFPPHLIEALALGEPVTVGVFGDSFGDGIWAALYRRLPKAGTYKVLKFSAPATGFVRNPGLAADTAARLSDQPVDIAVIDFGANDTQGLVEAGRGYALFSPGWRAAYGARVDALVAALRARGAMVYWVGLPKMRSPEYDQHVAEMNAFYAARMAALGVPYLSTTAQSVDETGQFNAYLADRPGGETRLMRAGDGVHMSMAGYERISAPLVARIEAYVARAAVAARLEPTPAPVEAAPAAPATEAGR
jgi:hypothetical protein